MADFRERGILGIDLNKKPDSEVECAICLEQVGNGSRGKAILQCGHEFHLNCIGSEFNVKGHMKCPNCRDIEWSDWLYSIDPRLDDDLFDWIADHHPFFVVPSGFRLCPNRVLIGPGNVPVGGEIIYGLPAEFDYEEEMAPPPPQQELQDLNANYHEALSPNNQIEATNVKGSDSQSASLNDINQVNGTHEDGSSNPPNLVQIRLFGRNHQSFSSVEVPTQNPSTAETVFSGHTISGSSSQRVGLFNTIVPYEINREATSSPLAPAVRRAPHSLTPPAGESSTITSTTAAILILTGGATYNPQTPVPAHPPMPPHPPQDNDSQ